MNEPLPGFKIIICFVILIIFLNFTEVLGKCCPNEATFLQIFQAVIQYPLATAPEYSQNPLAIIARGWWQRTETVSKGCYQSTEKACF